MNKQELQSLLEGVRTALTGNQSKLDKNQNNKIDREDFTLLRSKKKPMAENADLLALLEHLYGVLLDQKAARLNEWEQPNSASHRWERGDRKPDPSSFYKRNREDNDRIRMSIVRDAAKVDRAEKEEKERQRRAQNENAEYDFILEKIYNLLAEDAPPPTAEEPRGTVRPGYAPGTSPQERTIWWDYNSWIENHPNMTPYGPGPWNGTWEHPNLGTIFALPPSNWPGPGQGKGWQGWRDGKPGSVPLPPGDFPGSGMNGQWVFTWDGLMYYIYPAVDGQNQVWLWNGLPGNQSYFSQEKPWGYPS